MGAAHCKVEYFAPASCQQLCDKGSMSFKLVLLLLKEIEVICVEPLQENNSVCTPVEAGVGAEPVWKCGYGKKVRSGVSPLGTWQNPFGKISIAIMSFSIGEKFTINSGRDCLSNHVNGVTVAFAY